MSEPDVAEPSFADLPIDYINVLFDVLPLRDLVAASCTCRQWQTCSERIWHSRCCSRWHHWSTPPPASSSSSAGVQSWKAIYRQRHQKDAVVFNLLQDACWPDKQDQAYAALIAMGRDAIDALAAAAHGSCASSMLIGVSYHAHVALHYVVADLCSVELQQLIEQQQQQQQQEQNMTEAAAAAAAAAGAESAVSQAGGSAAVGATTSVSSSSSSSDVMASLEGALLLAQALHPLSNVAAVKQLVQQLGQELRNRMQSAQVPAGSKQAVELLNKLLFAPTATDTAAAAGASGTSVGAAAAAAPAGAAATAAYQYAPASSSRLGSGNEDVCSDTSSNSSSSMQYSWWRRDRDLDGPDSSTFIIPQDGRSGINLKGNVSTYYDVANSCLDSVLASKSGLPITLALLHAAVAAEAGLAVQMVNMPGHIISRAWISDQGSTSDLAAGSSGSSRRQGQQQNGDGYWLYMDAFEGGKFLENEDIRMLAARFVGLGLYVAGEEPGGIDNFLQPLTAPSCMRRMLMNIINSLKMGFAAHSGRLEGPKPLMYQLQLRSISAVLLAFKVIPATATELREAFDVFVQLGQMIGLGQYKGPPGATLLMHKMAYIMPQALQQWKVKIQAAITEMVNQQHNHLQDVTLRSRHPCIEFGIGDPVRMENRIPGWPAKSGIVTSWTVARAVNPYEVFNLVGTPEAAAVAAAAVAAVGGDSTSPSAPGASEVPAYTVMTGAADGYLVMTPVMDQLHSNREDGAAPHSLQQKQTWVEEQERQVHCLRQYWFEHDFPAWLFKGGEDNAVQSCDGWPEHHMAIGHYFDGVVSGGWCVPNASIRARFPEF